MSRYRRWNELLELLAAAGQLQVEEAAKALGVSEATVRRDLDELATQQMLTRIRGGAVAQGVTYDLPLRYKSERHPSEKQRIAAVAAGLVRPGQVTGLNGGTTTTEVARALATRSDLNGQVPPPALTVVTNALNIATELAVRQHIKIVATGGVARPQSYELTGPLATGVLEQVTLDVAILGVDGIDAVAGATAHHEGEASINRLMARQAAKVVIAADSSKVGRRAFARICTAARDRRAGHRHRDRRRGRGPAGGRGSRRCHRLKRRRPGSPTLTSSTWWSSATATRTCSSSATTSPPRSASRRSWCDSMSLVVGGSASITAVAAARLGLSVALVAAVGDDAAGQFMLDQLAREGVATDAVAVRGDAPTGMTVALSNGGDRAILTALGAVGSLTADDVPAALLRRARHVHISSYFLLEDSLGPGLGAVISAAQAAGATVSLDTNWDPSGRWGDDRLAAALARADLLLPNEAEAVRLSGEPDLAAAVPVLTAAGARLVVKLGARGALCAAGPRRHRVSVPPLAPVNATGAGDCFNAGLITGLLRGLELTEAAALGCAAGALSTRAPGGTGSCPDLPSALALAGTATITTPSPSTLP